MTNWRYFFFIFFTQETGFDIPCKLFPLETICLKCQMLFSGKNKKSISKCHLLKILLSVLRINNKPCNSCRRTILLKFTAPDKVLISTETYRYFTFNFSIKTCCGYLLDCLSKVPQHMFPWKRKKYHLLDNSSIWSYVNGHRCKEHEEIKYLVSFNVFSLYPTIVTFNYLPTS